MPEGERECREAARRLRILANQGDVDARYNLGLCYAKGRGVPQDQSEAAHASVCPSVGDDGELRH